MSRKPSTLATLAPEAALGIAGQMNYSPTDDGEWDRLERGIRLRDLGHIGIADSVLQKPTELTRVRNAHNPHENRQLMATLAVGVTPIDAMTQTPPYRKAITLAAALEQVRKGAGTHFDPDVAEAVLDAAKNGAFENPTT